MSNSIISQIHPAVQEIFDGIETLEAGFRWVLKPGDPFYEAPTDTCIAPSTQEHERGNVHSRNAIYDIHGERHLVGVRGVDWYNDVVKDVDSVDMWWVSRTPNAVLRAGDWLIIGRGVWAASGWNEDGMTEWISADRWQEINEQAHVDFVAAHPEIEACKPAWAESYDLGDTVDYAGHPRTRATVFYNREFGDVEVFQTGRIEGGTITLEPISAYAPAFEGRNAGEEKTLDELRTLIADLQAAADVWGAAL